ncbi:MAG: polyprenyl diphosphate synthase [Bacillota bacterium]
MSSAGAVDPIESMWLNRALEGSIPVHVGVIMDGNGRWARQKGLPRKEGHRAGVESMGRCLPALLNLGIKYCTLFAFSTENWRRPRGEVQFLMTLLLEYAKSNTRELLEHGIQIRPIGRWRDLPTSVSKALSKVASDTRKGDKLVVLLAINYGGRQEILDAVGKYVALLKASPDKAPPLTEEEFSRLLYSGDVPDPDLIVRTSGELRLSNFLLWESAYSELVFTDVLWPDFGPVDIYKAVVEYSGRKRRFGGLTERKG